MLSTTGRGPERIKTLLANISRPPFSPACSLMSFNADFGPIHRMGYNFLQVTTFQKNAQVNGLQIALGRNSTKRSKLTVLDSLACSCQDLKSSFRLLFGFRKCMMAERYGSAESKRVHILRRARSIYLEQSQYSKEHKGGQ